MATTRGVTDRDRNGRSLTTDRMTGLIKQFWRGLLEVQGLQASMSRRGNCYDNAVAESFLQLLKRERIKRHIYSTRNDAHSDIVDYIEMLYSKRRHSFNNLLSPVQYDKQFKERLVSV